VKPLAVAVTAVAVAAASAGCRGGGEARSSAAAPAAKPVGQERAGSVVQFANCGDWRRGSVAERQATVRALRGQLTPQRSKSAASPLPDEQAYRLLQNTCSSGPESLRLYKLYVRMQGFAPLRTEAATPSP